MSNLNFEVHLTQQQSEPEKFQQESSHLRGDGSSGDLHTSYPSDLELVAGLRTPAGETSQHQHFGDAENAPESQACWGDPPWEYHPLVADNDLDLFQGNPEENGRALWKLVEYRRDRVRIPRNEIYSRSDLKGRGWSDRVIGRFMPVHDNERDNPHYTSGYPMRFWLRARAQWIECVPELQIEQAKAKRRSEATLSRTGDLIKARRRNMVERIRAMSIQVDCVEPDHLLDRAIANYNYLHAGEYTEAGLPLTASKQSDGLFLQRIQVNYIRHCLTGYDEQCDPANHSRVKRDYALAWNTFQGKIYEAISKAYPKLSAECGRQRRAKRITE